jgi:Arc/MetJ family transcription regulator
MRTTVTIDDTLLAKAKEFTGIDATPALIRHALESLVRREAARQLIQLQGTEPDLKLEPRRRTVPARRARATDTDPGE